MGLIQRQGFKFSIVNWLGILIGALSSLYVFPNALEEYGLVRFILDTSTLLFPLVSLGSNSVIIRFFPYFEDQKTGHHGFLGLMLWWTIIGFAIVSIFCFIFKDPIIARYKDSSPLFQQYLWLVLPSLLLTALNNVFYRFSVNFNRIVIPSILLEVSQKIVLPILVLAYLQKWLTLTWMLYGLMGYLIAVVIGFIGYVVHLKAWNIRPDFAFMDTKMRQEMRSYALHGIIGGFALLLVTKLDSWLVGTMINLKKSGIYSISAFVANVIEVPARAVIGIGVPLMSKYWKENNQAEIENLYQKTSINLLILGLLLFGTFWVSVDAFFRIMANGVEMSQGKWVIFLLGLGRIVDMSTGLNNHILIYSDKFRYSYLQLFVPTLISLGLGITLTSWYGIEGAAMANLLAVVAYNATSIGINWYFFGYQPFTWASVKVILIAIGVYIVVMAIPQPANVYVSILMRSSLFIVIGITAIVGLGISPDLNGLISKIINKKVLK